MRVACLLLVLLSAAVFADDEFDYEERDAAPRFAAVTNDVNVRRDPAARSGRMSVLRAGEQVEVLGRAFGWVRVRTDDGDKGWVDRRFLNEDAPALAFRATAAAPAVPCPAALGDCTTAGCAQQPSEKLRNRLKRNRSTSGSATRLTLASFKTLQTAAMKKVGEDSGHLDADDRAKLTGLRAGGTSLSEGSAAVVNGYVVGEPHANKKENVNCNLGGEANNDYHISIAAKPTTGDHKLDEYRSIVVEMIPQSRPAGWTDEKLKKVRDLKRMVRVEGRLFYDDLHKVNSNPGKPIGGQPRRFSLWEIHPVTELWVCPKSRCTAGEWVKLKDWVAP